VHQQNGAKSQPGEKQAEILQETKEASHGLLLLAGGREPRYAAGSQLSSTPRGTQLPGQEDAKRVPGGVRKDVQRLLLIVGSVEEPCSQTGTG
jgi:hypothetical protein